MFDSYFFSYNIKIANHAVMIIGFTSSFRAQLVSLSAISDDGDQAQPAFLFFFFFLVRELILPSAHFIKANI